MEFELVALLMGAALAAGWIDGVVGGGGLLLLPALLTAAPNAPVASLLGTNKLASVFGTGSAALTYARRVKVDPRMAWTTAGLALLSAAAGASVAGALSSHLLRPTIMVVLVVVLAVVMLRPALGRAPQPRLLTPARMIAAIALCGVGISFYDGLVGPGTGTFLVIALATITGLDFVTASATAKIINASTNLGALIVFAALGHVMWLLGLVLGGCTLLGAQLGARTAMSRGTGFVRIVLVVVVLALLARMAYEQFG